VQVFATIIRIESSFNSTPWAYLGVPAYHAVDDHRVSLDFSVFKDDRVDDPAALVNLGISTNRDIRTYHSLWMDVRSRMNVADAYLLNVIEELLIISQDHLRVGLAIVLEVQVLATQLILMSMNLSKEVLSRIDFVDKGLLMVAHRHDQVFDSDCLLY
jgi:hypothetical protein